MTILVGDQEAVDWGLNRIKTFELRAPEHLWVNLKRRRATVWLLAAFQTVQQPCIESNMRRLHLSMTRTVTVEVEEEILRGGAGVGNIKYSSDDMLKRLGLDEIRQDHEESE